MTLRPLTAVSGRKGIEIFIKFLIFAVFAAI